MNFNELKFVCNKIYPLKTSEIFRLKKVANTVQRSSRYLSFSFPYVKNLHNHDAMNKTKKLALVYDYLNYRPFGC
jgi:hypothetical protein